MAALKLQDDDAVSEADRDTLAPLPPPTSGTPWGGQMPYSGCYTPQVTGYTPMPFNYNETASFASFVRDGSVHSGSGIYLIIVVRVSFVLTVLNDCISFLFVFCRWE